MGLGILSPGGREARAVRRAVEQLHLNQTAVRVEIERLGLRFKTFLALRGEMVALTRPLGFKTELPKGSALRVRVPDKKGNDLRFEVADPDFRLPNGRGFIVCPIPKSFATKSPRATERYATGRFGNLELSFPALGMDCRILDLSMSGCRIDPGQSRLEQIWSKGEAVAPAVIQVGKGISIPLQGVVPRQFQPDAVGLEFVLAENEKPAQSLRKLIDWLEKRESRISRVIEK